MNSIFALMQIMLESLPISSSGHMQLLALQVSVAFDRFLHGPTVLVLLFYFYRELLPFFFGSLRNWRRLVAWMILLVFSNSFTVLVYSLLEKFCISIPLWLGLACTGLALLSLRWRSNVSVRSGQNLDKYSDQNNYLGVMAFIGIVQGLARLPGVSRLGSTYSAAVWLGFTPSVAFRVSCALQVPLFAVGSLEGFYGMYKQELLSEVFSVPLLSVMFVAMLGAYLLLWLVEYLMVTQKIWLLGLYMLALSVGTFFG